MPTSPVELSPPESALCKIIARSREALLRDLVRYVAIPTGRNHAAGLDETRGLMVDRLERLGATVRTTPGDPRPAWLESGEPGEPPVSVLCERPAGDGPRVLIAGHLDTVHDPQSAFRELSVRADGRTATGPGCVDMKGGLVIALHALEALEEVGAGVAWSFFLNSDEETGTFHSAGALREASMRHDVGIALEPALGDGSLAIGRMGSGQFMVEAHGKAAHVGRSFTEGVSAVTALARALVAIGEMPEPEAGRILNVGPLKGGEATNAVPDLARAWGNVRYPDGAGAGVIEGQLRGLETRGEGLPRVRVHTLFNRPAKPRTPEVEELGLAARGVAEALGQSLPFAETGGVCDGNIMQDAGLVTIDTLGVRGGGLHTPEEWIEVASLVERCQLLAVLLCRIGEGRVGRARPSVGRGAGADR